MVIIFIYFEKLTAKILYINRKGAGTVTKTADAAKPAAVKEKKTVDVSQRIPAVPESVLKRYRTRRASKLKSLSRQLKVRNCFIIAPDSFIISSNGR